MNAFVINGTDFPEEFKQKLAENKQKSIERCARVKKPKTNTDRIRAMSDEELAEFIGNNCCHPGKEQSPECGVGEHECADCWLSWCKSPVEVDE